MREIRTSGAVGGGTGYSTGPSYPNHGQGGGVEGCLGGDELDGQGCGSSSVQLKISESLDEVDSSLDWTTRNRSPFLEGEYE
jgi:hypothetical protein